MFFGEKNITGLNRRNSTTGQVMILAVLALGGVVLGATTIAGTLMRYQIRRATDFQNSARAIFAADSGVECALYNYFNGSTCESSLTLSNGASYNYRTINALPLSPVAWWTFDEGAGVTLADSSGNGNNGVWHGTGSYWVPGRVGSYAGQFNGIDDYIEIPDSPSLRVNTFAVALWIFPRSLAPAEFIRVISKESPRNFGVYIIPNSVKIHISYFDAAGINHGVNSSADMTLNAWNHVVMNYDGATLGLYMNGSLDRSLPSISSPVQSAAPVDIGSPAPSFYFNGLLDDMRVYSAALSQDDITNLYNGAASAITIMSEGRSGPAARAFLFSL